MKLIFTGFKHINETVCVLSFKKSNCVVAVLMTCCLVFFLGIFKAKSDLFLPLQYLVLFIKVVALILGVLSYYSRHTVVSSSGIFPKGRVLFICVLGLRVIHQDVEKVFCLTVVSKIRVSSR